MYRAYGLFTTTTGISTDGNHTNLTGFIVLAWPYHSGTELGWPQLGWVSTSLWLCLPNSPQFTQVVAGAK